MNVLVYTALRVLRTIGPWRCELKGLSTSLPIPGVLTAEQVCAVAQTIRDRPVAAQTRIQSHLGVCLICGGKVATVRDFLRERLSSSVSIIS